MPRVRWCALLFLLLLAPQGSSALQLRWATGATDLSFTSATRCTLLLQADSAEARVPSEWRLLWTADSLAIAFISMDSLHACLPDEAQVFRIDAAATAADSAANQITAYLCSEGSPATVAQQILDLPAGGHGKLMVVALDSLSGTTIESNEVRYNGGVEGDYPSAPLGASTTHASDQLVIRIAGRGLLQVVEAIAQAPDSLWSLPLQITERSDSTLTAIAQVFPRCRPQCCG